MTNAELYRISDTYTVSCPGWNWGLCAGHEFDTREQAEAWIESQTSKDNT